MQPNGWALATLLLALMASPAGADDLNPSFEVATSFVWGQATELVLRDGTYNNPISRLEWPIPPSAAVTLTVNWPWTSWTSTSLSLATLWPMTTGVVIDEDWNTGTSASDLVYGNSQSTGTLTSWWTATIEERFRWQDFSVFVGGLTRRATWDAWGGTYSYQYVGNPSASGTFSGLVLDYSQLWFIPYLGVGWTQSLGGDITLTPSLRWGPDSWVYAVDNHLFSSNRWTFIDSDRGGQYLRADLETDFPGTKTWSWGVRATWEMDWGAVGDTTSSAPASNSSSSSTSINSAGDWFQQASMTLFVRN